MDMSKMTGLVGSPFVLRPVALTLPWSSSAMLLSASELGGEEGGVRSPG